MWKVSTFPDLYLNNKEEIDLDAENMTQLDFMRKYHIGATRYYTHFKGKSKFIQMRISAKSQERQLERQHRHEDIKKRAQERQYDDRSEYLARVKKASIKFWVKESYIRMLSLSYTISEIENWEKIDWKIVCHDEIRMTKPRDIKESMFSYSCWMI